MHAARWVLSRTAYNKQCMNVLLRERLPVLIYRVTAANVFVVLEAECRMNESSWNFNARTEGRRKIERKIIKC